MIIQHEKQKHDVRCPTCSPFYAFPLLHTFSPNISCYISPISFPGHTKNVHCWLLTSEYFSEASHNSTWVTTKMTWDIQHAAHFICFSLTSYIFTYATVLNISYAIFLDLQSCFLKKLQNYWGFWWWGDLVVVKPRYQKKFTLRQAPGG